LTLDAVTSIVKDQGVLQNAMNEIPIIEEVLNVFKNYCLSELSITVYEPPSSHITTIQYTGNNFSKIVDKFL
jgi:hypothetical protein